MDMMWVAIAIAAFAVGILVGAYERAWCRESYKRLLNDCQRLLVSYTRAYKILEDNDLLPKEDDDVDSA